MTIDEAVKADPFPKLLINGKWQTHKELAKATGLGIDTINRRWRKGLPIDEIVKPPKRRMTKYLYKGEMRSISAIAKLNGVLHGSLSRHIRNGMSLEKALVHMGVSD